MYFYRTQTIANKATKYVPVCLKELSPLELLCLYKRSILMLEKGDDDVTPEDARLVSEEVLARITGHSQT